MNRSRGKFLKRNIDIYWKAYANREFWNRCMLSSQSTDGISGNVRLEVVRELGIRDVPCRLKVLPSVEAERNYIYEINANRKRVQTNPVHRLENIFKRSEFGLLYRDFRGQKENPDLAEQQRLRKEVAHLFGWSERYTARIIHKANKLQERTTPGAHLKLTAREKQRIKKAKKEKERLEDQIMGMQKKLAFLKTELANQKKLLKLYGEL